MANEPWFYGKGWSIGPFNWGEDQDNAARKRLAELQAQMAPDAGDPVVERNAALKDLRSSGGFRWVPESPDKIVPSISSPGYFAPFEPSPILATPPTIPGAPVAAPASVPEAAPGVPAAAPVAAPPVAVPEELTKPDAPKPLAGIDPYLEAIQKFFPAPPSPDTSAQQKADANIEADRRRTNLLAQLAFASGLTAAGGGSWAQIGRGFAAAGEVYDQGFARYQKALQDSADRVQKQQGVQYQADVSRREAAVKLYSADQAQQQERTQKRAEMIDKWFDKELDAIKSDIGASPDSIADIQRRRRASLAAGYYIGPNELVNVSD